MPRAIASSRSMSRLPASATGSSGTTRPSQYPDTSTAPFERSLHRAPCARIAELAGVDRQSELRRRDRCDALGCPVTVGERSRSAGSHGIWG